MKKTVKQKFPKGWDEKKIRALVEYYDTQSDEEGAAEIESAEEITGETLLSVPTELVPKIALLISEHLKQQRASKPRRNRPQSKSAKVGPRKDGNGREPLA